MARQMTIEHQLYLDAYTSVALIEQVIVLTRRNEVGHVVDRIDLYPAEAERLRQWLAEYL